MHERSLKSINASIKGKCICEDVWETNRHSSWQSQHGKFRCACRPDAGSITSDIRYLISDIDLSVAVSCCPLSWFAVLPQPQALQPNFSLVFVTFYWRKSASRGNALLLVGPPDGGKTAILSTVSQLNIPFDQTYTHAACTLACV